MRRAVLLSGMGGLALAMGAGFVLWSGIHDATALDEAIIPQILLGYDAHRSYPSLTIHYPQEATVFPPESIPPTIRWGDDAARANRWLVRIESPPGTLRLEQLSPHQEWTPEIELWRDFKRQLGDKQAVVTVLGFEDSNRNAILSVGMSSFRVSRDEVGAPIFYRDVNLPFIDAVKDPTRIRWRFGSIASVEHPASCWKSCPCAAIVIRSPQTVPCSAWTSTMRMIVVHT